MLDTTMANIDILFLIRKQDNALNAYHDAKKIFCDELSTVSPWPGTTDPLVIGEPGMILISSENNQHNNNNNNNNKKGG